jgi:putative restriction endonuclease
LGTYSATRKRNFSSAINNITSASQLRTLALGARMDEDLFLYIQQPDSRSALREALLQSCFSEEGRVSLEEQAVINAEAYSYSLELEHKAHLPLVKETLEVDSYKPAVRDQAFRRIVVSTYDHRCALCGVRIITAEGQHCS